MTEKKQYFIDISKIKAEFKEHLDLAQNERLIFSARFGNGKTTFLRNFFENDDDYNAIPIYPINYSVASNEDVFELIKYDILFELIANKVELKDSVNSFTEITKSFLISNKEGVLKLLTPFLSVIPLIGGALQGSTERIVDFSKDALINFKNSKKNELDVIENYLRDFTNLKGSIYEENFYTELIASLVERLKFVNSKKGTSPKTVLIIDDLDRIDPEHIFRILNVFAAHQDTNSQGNKFGFDKVIVVCDIDNIRSLFHHKYGASTDFNGYIDKFYSVDVFKYNMMGELYREIDSILNTIEGNDVLKGFFDLRRGGNTIFEILKELLRSFVKSGVINVRNIVKLRNSKYILYQYELEYQKRYFNIQLWGLALFNVLKTIFGDYHELMFAFEKFRHSREGKNNNYESEWILKYLLLPIHCFGVNKKTVEIPVENTEHGIKIDIKLNESSPFTAMGDSVSIEKDSSSEWETVLQSVDIADFFYQTYKLAFDKQMLK